MEKENARLLRINQELTSQVTTLKKQFDQAMSVSGSIQQIYDQNNQLTEQINKLQEERDDMERRLNISIQSNGELQKSLSKKQNNIPVKTTLIPQPCKKEFESISVQSDILDDIHTSIQESKVEFDDTLLLQAASKYFSQQISSIDNLIQIFNSSSSYQQQNSKIQKYKKLYKVEKEKPPQKVVQEIKSVYEDETKINELKNQLRTLENKITHQKELYESITQKNSELLKENVELRTQMKLTALNNEESNTDKLMEVTQQMMELSSKLKISEASNRDLKKQVLSLNKRAKKLEEKISKTKSEIESTKSTINYKSEEKMKCEEQLKQLEAKYNKLEEKFDNQREISTKSNLQVEKLNQILIEKGVELQSKESELETSIQQNKELESQIEHLKRGNINLDKENKEFKEKLAAQKQQIKDIKTKLEIASQPVDPSDLIPLAAWSCSEFPKDLSLIVQDIASNKTTQTPTKLRHVLSVITRWFLSRNERIEQEVLNQRSDNQLMRTQLDTLIEFLRQTFLDANIEFYELLTSSKTREEFVEYVNRIRTDVRHLLEMKSKNEQDVVELLMLTHVDNISDVKQVVENLMKSLKRTNQKLERTRKDAMKAEQQFTNKVALMRENVETQESQMNQIIIKFDDLEKEKQTINSEKEKFIDENTELKGEITKCQEKIEEAVAAIRNLKEQLQGKKSKIKQIDALNSELETELNNANKRILMLNKRIEEVENELNKSTETFKNQLFEMENEHKDMMKKERENQKNRNEIIIQEMKKQNEEYTRAVKELKAQVIDLQKKNGDLEITNNELQASQSIMSKHFSTLKRV